MVASLHQRQLCGVVSIQVNLDSLLDVHLHQASDVLPELIELLSLFVDEILREKPVLEARLFSEEAPLLPVELLALDLERLAKVAEFALAEVDFVKVGIKILGQELSL